MTETLLTPTPVAAPGRATAAPPDAAWAETRIDAAARAAWRDPVQFRRERLPTGSRGRRVLDEVARRAGWWAPPPAGRARGIALLEAGGAWVGLVAEVQDATVRRLVMVADGGPVVDFDDARQSLHEALAAGLADDVGQAEPATLEVAWLCSEAPAARPDDAARDAVAPAVANAGAALAALRARDRALARRRA